MADKDWCQTFANWFSRRSERRKKNDFNAFLRISSFFFILISANEEQKFPVNWYCYCYFRFRRHEDFHWTGNVVLFVPWRWSDSYNDSLRTHLHILNPFSFQLCCKIVRNEGVSIGLCSFKRLFPNKVMLGRKDRNRNPNQFVDVHCSVW